jgi:hypothetical protein
MRQQRTTGGARRQVHDEIVATRSVRRPAKEKMRTIRRRVRQRRWSFLAIVTLVVVGVVMYLVRPSEDLRAGSVEVGEARVEVGDRIPRSYRIVYRSESRAGDDVVVNIEDVLVRRPFEARSVSRGVSGESRTTTVNAFARLVNDRTTLAMGPSPAPLDRRPDVFLRAAVEAGYAEQREARRVARRQCRIFRMAGSPAEPSLERVSEAGDTYSEICVDGAGLVLEELNVTDGKMLTRRIATRIDLDPDVPKEAFDAGEPSLGVRQGGGSVRQMEPDSRPPGTFWELDDEPDGFEHRGRYVVVPPQTGFDDPTQRSNLVAFTSDVWVDGPDALVIEQGATLGGSEPFAEDLGADLVDAGELGDVEVVYGYLSVEVRALLGGGRFIRIFGTLPPDELIEIAKDMREEEGGTIEFVDEDRFP